MRDPRPRGVFAGLATLDVIHRVDAQPTANQKVTARAQFVAAGGPAANAAVTFAALGGDAVLITALGQGTIAETIAAELGGRGVDLYDIAPDLLDAAPVSSVSVTDSTGERAVIGGDAAGLAVGSPAPERVRDLLEAADIVLLDGHHPELARAVALIAEQRGLSMVLDAGRWKPIMAELIGAVTDVVASADFRTPGTTSSKDTLDDLVRRGVRNAATTLGAGPVRWASEGRGGEVPVPSIRAVDTLGAGDVFHGAYAFALATGASVEERLRYAAEVASVRCSMVGPRSWLSAIAEIPGPGVER